MQTLLSQSNYTLVVYAHLVIKTANCKVAGSNPTMPWEIFLLS